MKKIGIFGGTFNPIHNGHLKMAEAARKEYKLDLIYFIPCGIPPHRRKKLYPGKFRYEMVSKAVKNKKYFKVLSIEIKKKKPAYTVDTIRELRYKQFNKASVDMLHATCLLYFLIGADEFENLKKWKSPEKLATMVTFLVLPRPKENIKAPKIKNLKWHMVHTKPINISSTGIRERIKEKKSIRNLVPDQLLLSFQGLFA